MRNKGAFQRSHSRGAQFEGDFSSDSFYELLPCAVT